MKVILLLVLALTTTVAAAEPLPIPRDPHAPATRTWRSPPLRHYSSPGAIFSRSVHDRFVRLQHFQVAA